MTVCCPAIQETKAEIQSKKPLSTMLATYKNVLFLDHNHLLTTGIDDLTLWLLPGRKRVKGHQYRWLAVGYDLEIGYF